MAPEEQDVAKPVPQEDTTPPPEQAEAGGAGPGLSRIVFPVIIGLLAVAVIALFSRTRSQAGRLEEVTGARRIAEEQAQDLERDLAERIREMNEISDQLRVAETGRRQLQTEVSELQASRMQDRSRLESLESRNRDLSERLQAEQAVLAELQTSFRESREAQGRYLEQIERLLQEKNDLQDQLAQARTVEMPGLLVRDGRPVAPALRGTVLKVNREYDFVVVNRGSGDGVHAGTRFRILDGDREVGAVTATRVLPDMTVADVDRARTHRQLRTGFTVLLDE